MEPRPFDEPALVRSLGMEYLNPVVRQGMLDDAMMERFLAAVRGAAGRTTLIHCNSANRIGGAMIPYLMLDQGLTEEDAVVAGDLRATLEAAGTPIGPYDLLIAAQALRNDATLVTANAAEFARVPSVRWQDWAARG